MPFKDLGLIFLSYLLGGIPFSYLLGKLKGKDLLETGDRNPGAWNLMFNVNKKAGILGVLLDGGKGLGACLIGAQFGDYSWVPFFCVVSSVAGHNWSPFLRLKGGKGVAACVGGILGLSLYALLVFGVVALSLLLMVRRMALGILGGVAGASAYLFISNPGWTTFLFGISLLLVMAPKYLREAREMKARLGDDRREVKDLFTAKP
ncbi:MAG: glycerol-3-phosphate acyltransferase [Caldiserica bacterium]|jgi:acyl-phosphate glycerol 3-phosphate acyltransferase|nr:glycerol-3-phosphate acyltransferase [Caldisericota bacterium]MDH7562169.1 glycerol-3-phosphate acyltransferase [Caldisericota bacterium]